MKRLLHFAYRATEAQKAGAKDKALALYDHKRLAYPHRPGLCMKEGRWGTFDIGRFTASLAQRHPESLVCGYLGTTLGALFSGYQVQMGR